MASHTLEPVLMHLFLCLHPSGKVSHDTSLSCTISQSFGCETLADEGPTWKVGGQVIPIGYQVSDLSPSRELEGGEQMTQGSGEKGIHNILQT